MRIQLYPLNTGKFALIDDEDYPLVKDYRWHSDAYGYAVSNVYAKGSGRKNQRQHHYKMHRIINKTPANLETDHINHDKLDNRKDNLRSVTRRGNSINHEIQKNNTSGIRGVVWDKANGKWRAQIKSHGINKPLGRFSNIEDAAAAYAEAASVEFEEVRQ